MRQLKMHMDPTPCTLQEWSEFRKVFADRRTKVQPSDTRFTAQERLVHHLEKQLAKA